MPSLCRRGVVAAGPLLLAALMVLSTGDGARADVEAGTTAYLVGDYATALVEWKASAEANDPGAQHGLGLLYTLGLGVPQDYGEAVKWYRLAAQQGYAAAQNSLGVMYEGGNGVPLDLEEAARWYRRAATQGLVEAQFNLGAKYATGEGMPQDDVLAYFWLALAAAQGDLDAAVFRGVISKRMTAEDIAEAQRLAREWKPTSE